MFKSLVLIAWLASPAVLAQSTAAPAAPGPAPVLSIADLYSEHNVIDAAISPSGKFIAATVRRKDDDIVVILDLATGKKSVVTHINKDAFGAQIDVRLGFITWKTENRLLFQLRSRSNEGLNASRMSLAGVLKLGNRLYGVDRDGKNVVPMFNGKYNEALVGAFDTSDVASMLNKDPKHILIRVGGWEGRSLFKVDVDSGDGKIVEPQKESVVDWWLGVDGSAIVRVEYSIGTLRFYRKLDDGKWKKYYSARRRDLEERPDFELIGPSSDPNKFYVLARPDNKDRTGVYLYDLPTEDFGEPVVEHPTFDVYSARISIDGNRVLYYCYDAHVRICEFADKNRNAAMRALRKFFDESANVEIHEFSDDGNTLLLSVEGPSDPPAYYYYLVDQKKIEFVGLKQGALANKALPIASVINYKTRDGQNLSGYLTLPPGAKDAKKLPLVLMPHGGPQSRDLLNFDPWVQYLAGRGYAVFQPNFRGSGGFGKAFEYSGHREWGAKMQDDLGDGVTALAELGVIDPDRVCIFGASYGGYAALAGATLTPTAYKCAIALAPVADLEEFLRWKKRKYGGDSDTYEHWVRVIGDPEKDHDAIQKVSPAMHVDAVKIPILLIHGDEDESVPIEQSEDMQKLLQKAGRKSEFLKLKNEGHGGFEDNTSKVVLSAIGGFLWEHLGPGAGVTTPPEKYIFAKK